MIYCKFMNCWMLSFTYLWAQSDGVANLLWVQVVIHDLVNDSGKLRLHESIALLLQACPQQTAKGVADLFCKCNNLVLCGVAGDEVVQVGDDVDADRTGQLVPALGDGDGGGHQGGEEEEGCLHHLLAFVLCCCLRCFS